MSIDKELMVVKLYEGGASMMDISREMDLNTYQIRIMLIKNGVEIRSKENKIDRIVDSFGETIVELYKSGISKRKIASMVGIEYHMVYKVLYYTESISICEPYTEKKIIDMYREGFKQADIYRNLNIPISTVEHVLGKANYYGELEKRNTALSIEDIKLIEDLYISGVQVNEIAKICGRATSTVSYTVRCSDRINEKSYRKASLDDTYKRLVSRVIQLRLDGISREGIAKDVGRSNGRVSAIILESIKNEKDVVKRIMLAVGSNDEEKCNKLKINIDTVINSIKKGKKFKITKDNMRNILSIAKRAIVASEEDLELMENYYKNNSWD